MLTMLGKISSKQHIEVFFLFSQKTGFDIPCKLSLLETICMQIVSIGDNMHGMSNPVLWENKKNIIILLSVELESVKAQ